MRLPSVSISKILEALNTFDQKYRNTPQFTGWETYANQKYAIIIKTGEIVKWQPYQSFPGT